MTLIQSVPTPSIRRTTAEEFAALPDAGGLELDNGFVVEKGVGTESDWIAGEIFAEIRQYVRQQKLGWVFPPETAFQCFTDDADRVRKPDAAFVSKGRLSEGKLPLGYCKVAPDLAVEVVSPNDIAVDVERKILQYLAAGVKLVWVVYPETRTARVIRLNRSQTSLGESDLFDGETVLPGFSLPLASVFPAP